MPTLADGTLWRYRIVGSDPGDGWTAKNYDDTSWAVGPQPIGSVYYYTDCQTDWPSAPVDYLQQRLFVRATANGTMTVDAWDDNGIQVFRVNGGADLVGAHTHTFYGGEHHLVSVPVVAGETYAIAIEVINQHGPGYGRVNVDGPVAVVANNNFCLDYGSPGWKYLVSTTEPTGWKEPGFDDSAWGTHSLGWEWTSGPAFTYDPNILYVRREYGPGRMIITNGLITIDDSAEAYLNGTVIGSRAGEGQVEFSFGAPLGVGSPPVNVLAFRGVNNGGWVSWFDAKFCWELDDNGPWVGIIGVT